MKTNICSRIHRINYLNAELDALYHHASLKLGLTDSASIVLYTIYDNGEDCLLSDIYKQSGVSKQTVNSALKKLEQEGLLELRPMSDKRSKRVHLTVRGRHLASQTVDLVLEAEYDSIGELSAKEQSNLLYLYKKYTRLLAFHMGKLTEALEEEKEKKKHED